MKYAILVVATLATALAAGAAPSVETVQVKAARAKVEGDDGAGLFLIGRDDYVFAKVGNPKRQVIAYDPVRRRVRISALDKEGMWIQCAYLEPSKNACPAATPAAVLPSVGAPESKATPRPTTSPSAVATAKPALTANDRIIADLTGIGADDAPSATATAPATRGFRLARPAGSSPAPSTAAPARARPSFAAPAGASPMSRAPAALPDCPGDPRCP